MSRPRSDTLPIDEILPRLLAVLAERSAAVLQVPPGAGKTTRVPLALLDQPWLRGRRVLMLEPRRLAARAAARFMAAQLGEPVGHTVGYRMRLDTRVSEATRIEVVTEGVLTRLLQDDPELGAYGAVVFDEFHERSLQADLGLVLVREAQQALREELRILVMSATLDAGPVARLLDDAPLISSAGRSYPVEARYRPGRGDPVARVAAVVREALAAQTGSLLVFLPGGGEIRRVVRALADALPAEAYLAPLYGDLDQAAQDAALVPAPPGRRKVVLATAIAETSLTIEGVRVVVDAGLERRAAFDPVSGMTRLLTRRVSRAAAEQRLGRAGRLEPGVCYRLWAEEEQGRLAAFSGAEILDADLSGLALELAQWGVSDPSELRWLDPPPAPAWEAATALLRELGALDGQGRISAHGRELLSLGQPPRLGHMLLRGRGWGLGRLAAEMAALLGARDPLARLGHADLGARLQALRHDRRDGALRPLRRQADALARSTGRGRDLAPILPEPQAIGLLLAQAYPDRVALRRPGRVPRYQLANGRGAVLSEDDPLAQEPCLVAAALDGNPREARIFLAAPLALETVAEHFGDVIERHESIVWDEREQAVKARRQRRYRALVLEDAPLSAPNPEAVLAALLRGVRAAGLQALPWDEGCRQWRARVALLSTLEPEHWPAMDDQV
ncbi:ATP-dependent helicase HrpB [Alkalilimnicola sp. S0819]|uniref:ATP-dependent helicase HrpB n=1 Tax=Alkalilimnicola sp. S0819 TaxID=2613922 RepID=UPI0012627D12|nr:ATP-dependent helicase HrpB [Alkalilimnicola sp. S0819]KAB7624308.1 ATP-dependent helicase HrpB [Alkalilimnicola sp. S0819]MPQ16132.1 ATP-dependent helicase HrpB [Alkalilimnicola sp. S0819]